MNSYMNFVITAVILVCNAFFLPTWWHNQLLPIYMLTILIGLTKSNPHFMNDSNGNEITSFVMLLYIKFFVC
jgi:uncharacterized membrane protein